MTQRTRWFGIIAVLAVLIMVLGACGPKATPTAAPAPTEAPKAAEPTKAPEAAPTAAPVAAPTEAPAAAAAWDNTPDANDILVRNLAPDALPEGWKVPAVVGHVTNYLMHEWYQNETKGEETRSKDWKETFSINDANLDLQKSLAAVDDYLAKKTDAIVFTPVVDEASAPTIKKAVAAGMPIICEGNPTSGCLTMVAIDDYMAGVQVGKWAGDYIKQNLDGKANVLDISIPALKAGVNRSQGFTDGLKSIIPDAQFTQVDGKGLKDEAIKVAADALTANPDTNVIFGINDDSALGGLQSYTAAGMDPNNLLVVGFGCEGKACKNALMEGGPYKVSAAMFPEYQGRLLMDTLIAAYNGAKLPEHVVAPTLPITKDNLAEYYTQQGEEWIPNFEATGKLPYGEELKKQMSAAESAAPAVDMSDPDILVRNLAPDALPEGWKVPAVVGHVTNYLMHEWYQNETKGEEARSKDWKETFSINDANLDLQKSLAAVDDYLAKKTDAIVFTPVVDEASAPTIKKAVAAGMPIICEGNPTSGCLTMVAIDDYMAGVQVGLWAGDYIKQNLDGKANVLDISIPALKAGVNRSKGFTDGLKSIIPDAQFTQVDGKGLKDEAIKVAADALTANPDTNVIFGINDDSALGGLQSYTAAGMDPNNLLVVGFGCEGKACKNALMEGGPYKVSAAMFPEYQGRLLMDTLIAAYNGVKLPEHVVAPTLPITKDNLAEYYTQQGDEWIPNFEATGKLPYGDPLREQLNWTQQP